MLRQRVESATIISIGYAEDFAILEVEFTSGDIYRYFEVDPDTAISFLNAASKGRFFAEKVRDKFDYLKISQ